MSATGSKRKPPRHDLSAPRKRRRLDASTPGPCLTRRQASRPSEDIESFPASDPATEDHVADVEAHIKILKDTVKTTHMKPLAAGPKDIVTNAAVILIAPAGTATQGAQGAPDKIVSYAFDKEERLVTDARAHIIAEGDAIRTEDIVAEHAGGGGMNTDGSGCMISIKGDAKSSVHLRVMSGPRPRGWKPYFQP